MIFWGVRAGLLHLEVGTTLLLRTMFHLPFNECLHYGKWSLDVWMWTACPCIFSSSHGHGSYHIRWQTPGPAERRESTYELLWRQWQRLFVSLASTSKWIQQRLHLVSNNPEKPTVQHLNCHVLTIPPAKHCQQCGSLRVSLRVLAGMSSAAIQ